ncbi:MAG: glycosyltransferase [Spirochaetes bacterium]|nr:glycosyltransferase [Spirochaetota bacterium]
MSEPSPEARPTIIAIFNGTPQWNTPETVGLSGGDRILFESLRHWTRLEGGPRIELLTDPSGFEMLKLYDGDLATRLTVRLTRVKRSDYRFLAWLFPKKTRAACRAISRMQVEPGTIFFSASDLFPDSLPGLYARRRHPQARWCGALYFFSAPPWSKEAPYRGLVARARGFLYWASQRYCYRQLRRHADTVVTCNDADREVFIQDGYPAHRLWSIYGGVDLSVCDAVPEPPQKTYDAVFMARFHPQKGPLEAVKAWAQFVRRRPEARLAMIGNGPEEGAVRAFIAANGLEKNIHLMGYMDGEAKYRVLKASRLFLHPAVYETGGMAAAEGMAAGLPVVAFDHRGFDYCYPKGLVRIAPVGDTQRFALAIERLLTDGAEYARVRGEALELSRTWDWSSRSALLLEHILKAGREAR